MRFERPPEHHARKRELYREPEEPILPADKGEEYGIHHNNDREDRNIEIPLAMRSNENFISLPRCRGAEIAAMTAAVTRMAKNGVEIILDNCIILNIFLNVYRLAGVFHGPHLANHIHFDLTRVF